MILLLTDLIGLTFYTLITLDFPFSGSVDIVPKKRGSSLFQVGKDEIRKKNLELSRNGCEATAGLANSGKRDGARVLFRT